MAYRSLVASALAKRAPPVNSSTNLSLFSFVKSWYFPPSLKYFLRLRPTGRCNESCLEGDGLRIRQSFKRHA